MTHSTPSQTTAVPEQMTASVLTGPGAISLETRAVPVPDPDQVLIRVDAVGVCGSDVHYYHEGRIGDFVVESPMVLGHEAGGVIVAVGSDVDSDRVGQRVSIEPQRPRGDSAETLSGAYNLDPAMEFYATPPIDGAFAE
ncbi:MAG: alcohol dehydrogenase catalytic domain-containing protein, partial [Mycetocola sp.]